MWNSFGDNIDIVLTHPNGYEGPQQSMMRQAAVLAGLVPDASAAEARVRLVTEGEASLHYCLQSGLSTEAIKVDLLDSPVVYKFSLKNLHRMEKAS